MVFEFKALTNEDILKLINKGLNFLNISMSDKIKEIILEINDYDVCEISYYEIKGANKEFLEWIENETI